MTVAGRIARNAGALAGSQGVTLVLTFVTWAHLARTLAPEGFGVLGFGTALLAYFAVIVQLGFDAVVMREAARDPDRVPDLAGSLTALRLLLAAIALVAYALVVWSLPRPPLVRATLLVQGVQLVVLATRLNWAFQALEKMRAVAVRDAATAVLNAAAVLLLIRRPDQILLAAVLTAGVPLVGNAWLWVAYRKAFGRLRLRARRAEWMELLRPTLPLAAPALMIELYLRLDQVMLEFLYSTASVGLYSAAIRLVGIAQVPATIIYGAFFPAIAAAHGDAALMRERGRMMARMLLAISVPLVAAGPWLAADALTFAFGAAYASAAPALAILLVNAGVVYLNTAVGTPLMAWNLQTWYMWAVIGGAAVNVVLNVVLIPSYGLTGAAAATLAAETTVCLVLSWFYRRATGELPFASGLAALPVAAAAALPAVLGARSGWPLPASVATSVAAAAVVAWRLGLIDPAALRPAASPAEP